MTLSRTLLAAASALFLASPTAAQGASDSQLQSILKNTHGSSEYRYPTDFTRGILPVSMPGLVGGFHLWLSRWDYAANPMPLIDPCSFSQVSLIPWSWINRTDYFK